MRGFETISDECHVELLDHSIHYGGPNRLGEVSSRSLPLRGWASQMDFNEISSLGDVKFDMRATDNKFPATN
jgi:hypothetical protein